MQKRDYKKATLELAFDYEARKVVTAASIAGYISMPFLITMGIREKRAFEILQLIADCGIVGRSINNGEFKILISPTKWVKVEQAFDVAISEYEIELRSQQGDYSSLLNDYLRYLKEYINYFFNLELLNVSVHNIETHIIRDLTATVYLEMGAPVKVGQIRYRLKSLADYIHVRYISIIAEDMSRIGLQIPLPDYLKHYPKIGGLL